MINTLSLVIWAQIMKKRRRKKTLPAFLCPVLAFDPWPSISVLGWEVLLRDWLKTKTVYPLYLFTHFSVQSSNATQFIYLDPYLILFFKHSYLAVSSWVETVMKVFPYQLMFVPVSAACGRWPVFSCLLETVKRDCLGCCRSFRVFNEHLCNVVMHFL